MGLWKNTTENFLKINNLIYKQKDIHNISTALLKREQIVLYTLTIQEQIKSNVALQSNSSLPYHS